MKMGIAEWQAFRESATQGRLFTSTGTKIRDPIQLGAMKLETFPNTKQQATIRERWIRGLDLTDGMVGCHCLLRIMILASGMAE